MIPIAFTFASAVLYLFGQSIVVWSSKEDSRSFGVIVSMSGYLLAIFMLAQRGGVS